MISASIVQFFVIGGIWGTLFVVQSRKKKRDKEFYQEKVRQAMLVGDTKAAEMYIKILSNIK